MKKSLGAVPKTRLKRIFEALMVFANEKKRGPMHLKHAHQVTLKHGQQPNQVYVRTSTAALADLTNQYEALQDKGINEPLVSWQVAETLEHLETTLGILVDCRRKRQGATERYFKLELWYPLSEVRLNLAEVNCRWPKSHSSVSKQTSDLSLNPFARNRQLLKLISVSMQPITWKQFAIAIGLSEENELQSKKLLAETCILLLDNPPHSWNQYLYRFSPLHLLEAGAGEQLLSFLPQIPPLQRSTVDLIVDQMVHIQSWPSGETNSFLLQLAHSEEWASLQTLIEIAWKLLDAGEEQLATQLVTLISDKQLYKSQINKLFEIKQAAISQESSQVIFLAGKMLRSKGLPTSLKAKVIYLLIQGLINTGKNHLAWNVCERAIKNVSPETDLEDWLRFQCNLCHQDIFFGRNDCAGARLIGLEKIISAQHSKHFHPLILQLKGEYYQSLEDYSQAQSNFQASLEQYQMLRQFSMAQELINKLSKIHQEQLTNEKASLDKT
jgi:tetratricopeptide (TPR) repeat protein